MKRRWLVGVVLSLGGLAALRLASLPALPFCNRPSPEVRFLLLPPGQELVQTITIPWDGFSRLRVRLDPGRYRHGELEARIVEGAGPASSKELARVRVPLSAANRDGYLDIDFGPVPASRGRTLGVALRNPSSSTLGLWVNGADTYADGELSARGQRGGDLIFVAFSARHEPVGFLTEMTRGRPGPLSSYWTVFACVGLFVVVGGWLCFEAFRVTRGSG